MRQDLVYVWRNNQVEVIPVNHEMLYMVKDCLLVDERCVDQESTGRYGKYTRSDKDYTDSEDLHWEYVPFDYFPKEFKAHLLLLGIE